MHRADGVVGVVAAEIAHHLGGECGGGGRVDARIVLAQHPCGVKEKESGYNVGEGVTLERVLFLRTTLQEYKVVGIDQVVLHVGGIHVQNDATFLFCILHPTLQPNSSSHAFLR